MIHYYKALTNRNNKLVSSAATGVARVEYPVGEWVTAPKWLADKGYHLCVFVDINSALSFAGGYDWVYECDVRGAVPVLDKADLNYLEAGILQFYSFSDIWPNGTRMFREVRIKEDGLMLPGLHFTTGE